LEAVARNLVVYLKEHSDLDLANVAFTLQVGRRRLAHRCAFVCSGVASAIEALESSGPKRVMTMHSEHRDASVAFMFPGQGAQYVNMAACLYREEAIFRTSVDECAQVLAQRLGIDLREILFPSPTQTAAAERKITETFITQPALFIIEYALARLWIQWGIRPRAVIGHSLGEYVAACLAGVMTWEDALSLVAERARLMQQLPTGGMLAVRLPITEIEQVLESGLSIAAVNSPSVTVVSGPYDAVEAMEMRLAERGVGYRRLATSHAFHSTMMDPILEPIARLAAKIRFRPPQIAWVSCMTGNWMTASQATDPTYWARQLREPVRFADAVGKLVKDPQSALLEVGPGNTLANFAKQHPDKSKEQMVLTSLGPARELEADTKSMLVSLGALWLVGSTVDWRQVHGGEGRHRLPLPTYPFERQRYWVEAALQTPTANISHAELHKRSDIASWVYVPSWKRADLPSNKSVAGQISSQGAAPVLIIGDGCGLAGHLAKRLEQQGQDVVAVLAGAGFERFGDRAYTIRPHSRADYDELIKDLRGKSGLPDRILHLGNVGAVDESCEEASGFRTLLPLVQALGRQNVTTPLRIEVVSTNIREVIGNEPLSPNRATLLGLCKVIPQEYPNITCRSIDIVAPESSSQADSVIGFLLAEFAAPVNEVDVAYRGMHRWVQTYERVQANEAAGTAGPLRRGGVYLISGGLGHIGLVCAEYLARKAQAKLILVGRSKFPAPNEWSRWLATHDPQDEVSRKIDKLRSIEALGAEVMIASADVASPEQMSLVIEQAKARYGKLHGVIHSAGVVSASSFTEIKKIGDGEVDLHFRPKARGLAVLENVLSEANLDFWLLQSSLSTVLGGLGMAAYAAANVFMDAFAQRQNQTSSVPWISVNWDGWQFEGQHNLGRSSTELLLTPEEGEAILERVLDAVYSQVIVSTGDLQGRLSRWIQREWRQKQVDQPAATTLHPRPKLQNAHTAPSNETERILAGIWQELLGFETVGVHDDFSELGGDSLLATRLISRVREVLHVDLSVRSFFDAPTVAGMAEAVETLQWAFRGVDTGRVAQLKDREEGTV
jgi:acyl transferase domain-containing protein/acyl carrier protein